MCLQYGYYIYIHSKYCYQDIYNQIDLEDLHDPESTAGIILEMQDRQRYFEGQMAKTALEEAKKKVRCTFIIACKL